MAKVTVRLFARLAEIAGTRVVEVELGEGLTVSDVFAVVAREHPGMAEMRVAFAVNREYAEAGQALREGDEVALIPPVSGGADASSHGSFEGRQFGVQDLSAPLRYGRDDKGGGGYGRGDRCGVGGDAV